MKKIPSSIGKDIYHESGIILPDKRIASTGRIHYMSENTINRFETLQSAPCKLVKSPLTSPTDLRIELSFPNEEVIKLVDRMSLLYFWKQETDTTTKTRTHLYLEPQSINSIHSHRFLMNISHFITKMGLS